MHVQGHLSCTGCVPFNHKPQNTHGLNGFTSHISTQSVSAMGRRVLLPLALFLTAAHCLDVLGLGDEQIEITQNVTAVLGDAVYLGCRYLGHSEIQSAKWVRQINSRVKSKGLAGFSDGRPFNRGDFSAPESVTNLTVRMEVSSVSVGGVYGCEFVSEDGDFSDRAVVTVLARPEVQILVQAETVNGTHYQSVSCSAVGGRPPPRISWLVAGRAPSGEPFAVSASSTAHPNGTFTESSVLRFPTLHLQEEDRVACDVHHPTLPNPKRTTVRVETYARPDVAVEAEMVQRGGNDFWVVSCVSSGGRPDTDISLALSGGEEPRRENATGSGVQRSSAFLPAAAYEGRDVTCVFDHPKFPRAQSRTVALPSFYLTGVQLSTSETRDNVSARAERVELQEGERGVAIGLEVVGNVPRYNITCKKDDGPLPTGLELAGSSLAVRGPVELRHAGLLACVASYRRLEASLEINVTVRPRAPRPVPPTVRVDLRTEGGRRVIECSAAEAVPAANVSWLLPKGVSGVSWSNFTSHNGGHSVRGVLLLPACSPSQLTAECVINHPAFEEPEKRSITLPLCARTNITLSSSTEWRDGEQFTEVDCSADSAASAAVITWRVGDGDASIVGNRSEPEVKADGSVSARSSVRFLSSVYAGQNLTCTVEHVSLEASERRTVHVPAQRAPLLSVSLVRQRDSPLWLGVCACRGEAVGTNLTWVLPENAEGQTSLHSEYEGRSPRARLTYRFPLALHEGQELTCVYRLEHGLTEKRTLRIPRYYISAVRVLNQTTPLRSRYGGEPVVHRLALQEKDRNQRILLRVEGNVPQYDLSCKRSDGSSVPMEGLAVVFPSEPTERDGGLYTCCASFYHHVAAVQIQVEVMSEGKLIALAAMICVSLTLALGIILTVALWVCCTRNRRNQYQGRGSLSALMQDPGSPPVRKPATVENAPLVKYSIILDMKSAV